MRSILVIAPHPDDEAIGCGGSIASHIKDGDRVDAVFLTSGEKGGHGRTEAETVALREGESESAAGILKLSSIEFWRESDGSLSAHEAVIDRMYEKIASQETDILYVPHDMESHPDHRAAAEIVKKAMGRIQQEKRPEVRMYEVWTPLQRMDLIQDITDHVDVKRAAVGAYVSQCEQVDFEAAILGLNRYRGEMHCWPEGEYAEAFKLM
jgi:LmbE family N-acetylglucosaminyl deacetylase